jgi:hypothetical protein
MLSLIATGTPVSDAALLAGPAVPGRVDGLGAGERAFGGHRQECVQLAVSGGDAIERAWHTSTAEMRPVVTASRISRAV